MTVCHGVATDFVTSDYGSKCIATKRIKMGLTFLFEIAQFLTDIYNRSWLSFFHYSYVDWFVNVQGSFY